MGYSFGYNRAERLDHYHSGKELVLMLVDLVSRGGNLLLDIGPAADGTIPVIMEERLIEIGSWLKINGEAIYGSRPWKNTRQWSAGKVPKADGQDSTAVYDVAKSTEKPAQGQAAIEAFFTAKGDDIYVILPRWPGERFTARGIETAHLKSIRLLGSQSPLRYSAKARAVTVEMPNLPETLMAQPAWVLKFSARP